MSDKSSVLDKLKKDKIRNIIIVIGIIGIVIIFISNFFPNKNNDNNINENDNISDLLNTNTQQYEEKIEQQLEEIISSIDGAGRTKVMATLDRTEQIVYATEEKYNSDNDKKNGETDYVIIKKSDGTETAIKVTEIQPKIKGVIVVCDGGENPVVQERVIKAVTTVLGISSSKVCVTKISE